MPPSIGKRLWKSAENYTRHQKTVEKAVREGEQQDKSLSLVRVAALVPPSLSEVITAAADGYQVCVCVPLPPNPIPARLLAACLQNIRAQSVLFHASGSIFLRD